MSPREILNIQQELLDKYIPYRNYMSLIEANEIAKSNELAKFMLDCLPKRFYMNNVEQLLLRAELNNRLSDL